MTGPTRMFFPLKSNGSWFLEERSAEEFSRRIKMSLVLYDQLLFENGRFHLTVWETGQLGMQMNGSGIPKREEIRYRQSGHESTFSVSPKRDGEYVPLLSGPTVKAYEVDFFPVLWQAGIADQDFVQWVESDLTEEGKKIVSERTNQDVADDRISLSSWENQFDRRVTISAAHSDSMIAFSAGLPIFVDNVVAQFIALKNRVLNEHEWASHLNAEVLRSLPSFAFPDFTTLSWEEVVQLRESGAGQDFRSLINRLAQTVLEASSGGATEGEIQDLIQQSFFRELISELKGRLSTGTDVAVSLGGNLLPFVGWASSAADVVNLLQEKNSWVSLLQ